MPRRPFAKVLVLAAVALAGIGIFRIAFDLSWFAALVAGVGLAVFAFVWGPVEWAIRDAFQGPHDPSAVDRRALDRFARSEEAACGVGPDSGREPPVAAPPSPPRKDRP